MENKENNKLNVTLDAVKNKINTSRHDRYNYTPTASVFNELEAHQNLNLNSTAFLPNSNDLIQTDVDISTILFDKACAYDLNNELIMTAAYIKSNSNNEMYSNLDTMGMQSEIDTLYLNYLMTLTMKETLKKSFKEEEELTIKEGMELFKAHENLQKICNELEYEEKIIDDLSELVDFINILNEWIDENHDELKNFEANYSRFSELCSKARSYLSIANIHIPQGLDFEETVAVELRKATMIIEQINNIFDERTLQSPPEVSLEEKIEFELIAELKKQNLKLKDGIIKYNGLKIMQN